MKYASEIRWQLVKYRRAQNRGDLYGVEQAKKWLAQYVAHPANENKAKVK